MFPHIQNCHYTTDHNRKHTLTQDKTGRIGLFTISITAHHFLNCKVKLLLPNQDSNLLATFCIAIQHRTITQQPCHRRGDFLYFEHKSTWQGSDDSPIVLSHRTIVGQLCNYRPRLFLADSLFDGMTLSMDLFKLNWTRFLSMITIFVTPCFSQ